MNDEETSLAMSDGDRWRATLVTSGLFGLFCLLVVQYFFIQIVQGDKWTRVARGQHFFTVDEPFVRGAIFSNPQPFRAHPDEAQPLVLDIQKFHLLADPLSIPEEHREEVTNVLAHHLGLNAAERTKIRSQLDKRSRSRTLAMWLDDDLRDTILAWWKPFARQQHLARNALFFVSDYQRSYPFGKLLGATLHTVQHRRDEETGQAVPTGGLEYTLDPYLTGKRGKRRLMRSPRNTFEIGELIEEPQNGANVYLTIHHTLQAIVEEELAKGVQKVNAKGGWAVMMNPHSGEILALAQDPPFYPACYTQYYNNPKRLDVTKVKALCDSIEPGSIMKPLTAAIALLANKELAARGAPPLFDPDEPIDVKSGKFPGRSRPIRDPRAYSYLNLDMAMQRSSNIYFARLAERIVDRLGAEWYRTALIEHLGLGQSTSLELPGESLGLIPRIGVRHPNGTLEWSVPTPFSLAMGHNLQVNTVQILRSFAALANGGKLVQPTLIHKIVSSSKNGQQSVLLDNNTTSRINAFPQVLDSSIIARVTKAMKYVTKGKRSDIPGYSQAGKTGTAEKIIEGTYSKDKNVASFVGFAPAKDPLFVLIVCIDEPEKRYFPGIGGTQWGGYCAAPIFREIGRRSLAYLGVTPDDPQGYPLGDPRYVPDEADWVTETSELNALFEEWNGK